MAISEEVREQAEPGAARTRRARPSARLTGRRLLAAIPGLWGVTFLIYAFAGSIVFAVGLAVLAARKPNGIADRISMVVSMTGLSVAPYVLALVLIYIFAVRLQWFPAIGYTSLTQNPGANIRSLTLPAIAIGFPLFSAYTRLLRADIVQQMQRADYIVTAQAKGVPAWRVVISHALAAS